MAQHYYVTTPIYYANAKPHIGSAYTTALADMLTRYNRYIGRDSFFLTGTDEHGEKIAQTAEAAGKTPQQFVDEVTQTFVSAWKDLSVNYSNFIRTTDADHKQRVQTVLQQLYDKGDIYFGKYGGLYCVGCERFMTEKELVDGLCPDHKVKPTLVEEENYFFRMELYRERWIDHITRVNPTCIRPERYKNEVLSMLREPLEDLCISRPKSRLSWGIEMPFDKNYVTYVWFDALLNYLSGIGYPDSAGARDYWANAEHLIGKDIVKPHAVYWPTMLLAAGIPPYQNLTVHGFWNVASGKISKSLGNAVDPIAITKEFGNDALRYFLFREMSFGLDATFSDEAFDGRYNADLANNLGNLVSRSLSMVQKYRGGVVPKPGALHDIDGALQHQAHGAIADFLKLIEERELHRALESLWALIDAANVYIDRTKPWALSKGELGGDAAQGERLDTALYFQLETIRIVASLLTSILPETSRKILSALGFSGDALAQEQQVDAVSRWGRLQVGQKTEIIPSLFPRKEEKEEKGKAKPMSTEPAVAATAEAPKQESFITYDDFAKVQLRVGQIVAAEKVEKSEKLVKLQVDLGPELGTRQILAGIAKYFQAPDLVGRKVVVVANLKPAKLMGLESNGMLLAASDDQGNLELLSPGTVIPAGSEVR